MKIMDFNFALSSFITLFIIVDPIVNVPLFMAILANFKKSDRKKMVKKATIIAAIVLIIFTLAGDTIFRLLSIEMYSFRIAGGLLLFIISIEMLFGRRPHTKSSAEEEEEALIKEDVVVTPLAVPLLTGPGAITTGIVLFHAANGTTNKILLFLDIGLVFLISYFILSRSEKAFEILGKTGTMVIVRIMGLLLAAIAVQFVITGVEEAITGII
ncbi:MAG: NAAT family transporter [ANME-2 cluster archaeon]|nr:NAAT family transporter [ANME-2 cluster archaeon]MBC2700508.1 NAAT family transporter [ANME-2 cluster archaeon]MBC2706548.1 NAAT family transporter [ANME-2 cluster archaeon]